MYLRRDPTSVNVHQLHQVAHIPRGLVSHERESLLRGVAPAPVCLPPSVNA